MLKVAIQFLWWCYLWIVGVVGLLLGSVLLPGASIGIAEVVFIAAYVLGMYGLLGYITDRAYLVRSFWQGYWVLLLLTHVYLVVEFWDFVTGVWTDALALERQPILLLGNVLLYIPMYYATYSYAFRSRKKPIWRKA